MDLIKLFAQAMGQRDNDYLILQNKFHSVEVHHVEGRIYTDGENGFVSHDSLNAAVISALTELALYERGRAD